MRTRIKICGFTRAGDIRLACELGVDAIGLVFAPGSPRRVSLEQAMVLRQIAGPLVSVVALFMNNHSREVRDVVRHVQPNLLQFHGAEPDALCRSFFLPYIKTIPMGGRSQAPDMAELQAQWPTAAGFLLDGHGPGEAGGSGARFDWRHVPQHSPVPLIVAGGLAADNVASLVESAAPWAVDVSSGVEYAPGSKDGDKMRAFIDEVRRADQTRLQRGMR